MDTDFEGLDEEGTERIIIRDDEEKGDSDLVNLQMILVTSSLNHEYASHEFEKTESYHRRQELLERMAHLKSLYFVARKKLHYYNPNKLEQIESELRIQKQNVFNEHLA